MTALSASLFLLGYCAYQLFRLQSRLDRQDAQLQALLSHLGVVQGALAEPSDEVRALARQPGQHIKAIKAYRLQTGTGLKEAKAVIDRLAAEPGSQP